jgi:NAD(P)-dependent dehydrogenase (short-subunit alcohol dehydrogenase family)
MRLLITGSGRRVRTGHGIATRLALAGHEPILHYNTSKRDAECTKQEIVSQLGTDILVTQGDLTRVGDVVRIRREIVNRRQQIDGIIHCVGNYAHDVFLTNVESSMLVCKHLGSLIPVDSGGRIVLFGAAGVETKSSPWSQEYTDAKRELARNMRQLAVKLAPVGVTVNMISPGVTDYSITHQEVALPTGRYVSIEDITALCMFLLGPSAAQITGQNIEVAGGYALSSS